MLSQVARTLVPRTTNFVAKRAFSHETMVSGPPRVKISSAEKVSVLDLSLKVMIIYYFSLGLFHNLKIKYDSPWILVHWNMGYHDYGDRGRLDREHLPMTNLSFCFLNLLLNSKQFSKSLTVIFFKPFELYKKVQDSDPFLTILREACQEVTVQWL